MILLLALFGCNDDTDIIQGRVLIGPGLTGSPVREGSVAILDSFGEPFDTATIDPDGFFEATGPSGRGIFALVDGSGIDTTSFTGNMGQGTFSVRAGEIFGWPRADRTEQDALFEGCSDAGPVVSGEIRLNGVVDDTTGEAPLVTTGYARLVRGDTILPACFLDDDGVYDPLAEVTGATGRYVIYGAESGVWDLVYGYLFAGNPVDSIRRIYVPETGIAPQYPAWVDLPI